MVTRHNRTVKKQRVAVLARKRNSQLSFDDWLVDMGDSRYGTHCSTLALVASVGTWLQDHLDHQCLGSQA
jgi:hypothetical protein